MRILFIDWIRWQYTLNTPYSAPLGGSQSALCYLADQLQQRGHEVWLFNNTPQIQSVYHVPHLPLSWLTLPFLEDLRPDVAILLSTALTTDQLRSVLPPQTRLLLWAHHAADQTAVKPLSTQETHKLYDQIVVVSQWQKQQYIHEFKLPAERITVLQNAVAPCFENLFAPEESILKAKAHPLTLAYTSTPFRGLNLLLELMPSLEVTHPAIRLNVYSSMKVYQTNNEEDWQRYGNLYQRCHELPNVNYIGSLPQPELAQVLRSTAIWAYTNTFAETFCISALEAMASGCYIITSEFGALPETTAGFADLIPFPADNYLDVYKQALERVIQRFENPQEQADLDAHLRAQVDYINGCCTWSRRAYEWEHYLEQLLRGPAIVLDNWQRRLQYYFEHQQYKEVLSACEALINQFPDAYSWVAYQGAAYIALGLETEAQLLWSVYLSHFTAAEQDEITETWSQILLEIANISSNSQEIQFALVGYAYDFSPSLKGALKLLEISLKLNLGIDQVGHFLNQVIGLIDTGKEIENTETNDLIQLVEQLIAYDLNTPYLTEFIEALGQYPSLQQHLSKIIFELLKNDPQKFAPTFASVYLKIAEDKFGLYEFLARICCEAKLDELAFYCVNKLFDFSLNSLGKDIGILSKLHVLQTFKYDLNYSALVT
ncbi:MAG: glycosyltransferase family 4 protein [Thermosynechococcus sp. Uc]|uniref:glycosyltransferase family 4 protein n=1 Tax=Thermosynechococcus sp. Uc TaxID=3034853 RepID=UPI00259DF6BA|nr:glycosyltransferase family 4 protein [Thermosynechococcus sp. Uc]